MSTIPLPALDVKTTGPNPLQTYATMQNILSSQTENQTRQVQLQQAQQAQADQQAMTAALRAWDGKDPNDLPSLVLKNGGSANGVMMATQHLLDIRQKNAQLDEATLKNEQTRNDQERGRLLSILNAPQGQKQQLWDNEITAEEQAGRIKPGTVSHQYPGDDAATQFANYRALGSVLAKEASERLSATGSYLRGATAANEFSAKQNPQSPLYSPTPAAVSLGAQQGNQTMQQIQTGEATQAGNVAGAQAAARFPYESKLESIRQQVAQSTQLNKDAQDKIESTVLKPYEEKMTSIAQLQSAVQQASQGNVTAARAVALKLIGVTNPDGTKRYNEAEAERLINQGNVPQRIQSTVKNLLTGNNWTDQMQSDMLSFGDAQGQVAAGNLNRGIQNVNKLYGTNVGGGLMQNTAGKAPSAPPPGATMKVPGSDGKLHWSDGKRDLGVIE